MCSILTNPKIPAFRRTDSYDRLTEPKEQQLLKLIGEFPAEVAAGAALRKPSKLADFILGFARVFHSYYNATPVNNPGDPELTNQRLGLIWAARITLKNALALLGVEAPERM